MKTTIIFETSLKGHRYEYLYNLYKAASKNEEESYVFVLPYDYRLKEWDEFGGKNIELAIIGVEQLKILNNRNLLISAFRKSNVLHSYVKKYHATHVFLIFLMLYMPFLLWVLPRGVNISGIVYRSFLWDDSQKKGLLRRCLEWVRYGLMAKSSQMEKVLLLNDSKSADVFNERFSTDKFARLPDPYTHLGGKTENLKEKMRIAKSDNLFIQVGQLSGRKGTIEILDALDMLSNKEITHNHFYFAGKVADDIRESFYSKFDELESKGLHIYVKDEFVSFEFLNSLCASCDCMLVPYKNTCQSSGAIGYAAQYGKPIIGPSKGLLGYLIKHYRLGFLIDNICANDIYTALLKFKRIAIPNNYVRDNQLDDFLKMCLS